MRLDSPSGNWYWLAAALPALALVASIVDVTLLRLVALLLLVVLPGLDVALGEQPARTTVPFAARALLPTAAVLHIAAIVVAVPQLARAPFGLAMLLDACSLGVCSALALNTTHAACHARSRPTRMLGHLLNALCAHVQVAFEHRLHHARYASTADPSSAATGENLYAFFLRFYAAGFRYLRNHDARRAGGGAPRVSLTAIAALSPLTLGSLFAVLYGPQAALALFIQALVATLILFAGAYVGHYGLERHVDGSSKLVRGEPKHSWNDSSVVGKYLLLAASEHSYHHEHPTDPPWMSFSCPTWPKLPAPYSLMVLAAFIPPLFRRWMQAERREAEASLGPEFESNTRAPEIAGVR
jgi:alkane 1-monooxygenase